MDFSQEMINVLMQLGLNKQQISNQTTHKLVDYFVSEEGKEVAMKEALKCVDDMKTKLADLEHTYHELIGRVNDTCSTISAIKEAQEKHGELEDQKAKDALTLYASLVQINKTVHANNLVENAGYIVYAYLGGQAKRDVAYKSNVSADAEELDLNDAERTPLDKIPVFQRKRV